MNSWLVAYNVGTVETCSKNGLADLIQRENSESVTKELERFMVTGSCCATVQFQEAAHAS